SGRWPPCWVLPCKPPIHGCTGRACRYGRAYAAKRLCRGQGQSCRMPNSRNAEPRSSAFVACRGCRHWTMAVVAKVADGLDVETVPLLKFDVQKFPFASSTTPNGPLPVANLDATPVVAFNLVTVLVPLLATHRLLASEVIPAAPSPTAMVLAVSPSRLSLVSVPSKKLET